MGPGRIPCKNLGDVGEFVINAAVEELAEKVNATSKELPPGQCEADFAGLTLERSSKVRPPRVAESPAHLECRVCQIMSIGDGPIAANLVIGEVLLIHVADSVLDKAVRSIPGSYAQSLDWGETITAGAQTSSRWFGPEERAPRCRLSTIAATPSTHWPKISLLIVRDSLRGFRVWI